MTASRPAAGSMLRRLFLEMKPEWGYLGAAMGTQVFTSATSLAVPYISGKLVDASYGKETALAEMIMAHPVASCGAAIGFFTVTGSANLARTTLVNIAGERFALRLRTAMVHGIAKRETAFLGSERVTPGDLQTRIVGDVAVVQKATTSSLKLVRSLMMLSGGVPYLIYLSPTLSIGSLLLVPPMALAAKQFGATMKKRQSLVQKSLSDASSTAGEFASNFRLIRQFGGERAETERFDSHAKSAAARAIETSTISALFDFTVDTFAQAVVIGVISLGLYQVRNGQMTPGTLSQFVMLSLMVANHSWSLSSSYSKLMRGTAAAERIFELTDVPPGKESFFTNVETNVGRTALPKEAFQVFPEYRLGAKLNNFARIERAVMPEIPAIKDQELHDATISAVEKVPPHLEFKNVTFAYDKVTVLHDISIAIPPQKIVAVVGSSGSGKSTLSALTTRLFDPNQGTVYFNGIDIRELPDIRQRIAVVDQDHKLLNGTILENLRYPNQLAPFSAIDEALRIACADDFVKSKGLDLPIGSSGISGGQRQRLAVARAVVKILTVDKCKMLFLDEGLSNLDRYTGQRTWENLCDLAHAKGLTVVHVTHQQIGDIIDTVDCVVRLDQGRVTESHIGSRKK